MRQILSRWGAWRLGLLMFALLLLMQVTHRNVHAAATDTPLPVVVDNVEEWAVGAGLLYWSNNCFANEQNTFAELHRKPTGGGIERSIATINDGAQCITFQNMLSSGDGLYYFDRSQARIARMPLGEPYTPELVKALAEAQFPLGKALIESGDYLDRKTFDSILRVRKDGSGEIETAVSPTGTPGDILIVGATLDRTDSAGVFAKSIACETLPCDGQTQYDMFTGGTTAHGLLYRYSGGSQGSYRLDRVERKRPPTMPFATDPVMRLRFVSCCRPKANCPTQRRFSMPQRPTGTSATYCLSTTIFSGLN